MEQAPEVLWFRVSDRCARPRRVAQLYWKLDDRALDVAGARLHQLAVYADQIITPQVPMYFISIKPAARGAGAAARFAEANGLARASCEGDDRLHYIDIVPAMLDGEGQPRRDIFQWDGFHLNATGYRILSAPVKAALLDAEDNASVSD